MGPKRPEWVPKALEYAELERIAQAAGSTDPRARDPWPERDAALFAVFAGAGVCSGEAIAMRVGSVEAAERSPRLRVLGKGNKIRVIPVGPEVVAEVDRYLDTRVERAGSHSPTDPLFVRRLKRAYVPFNLQAMDTLVAGWYRRAGVIPPAGSLAHALVADRRRRRLPHGREVHGDHSRSAARSGTTASQPWRRWPRPWMRTSGSPDPVRS